MLFCLVWQDLFWYLRGLYRTYLSCLKQSRHYFRCKQGREAPAAGRLLYGGEAPVTGRLLWGEALAERDLSPGNSHVGRNVCRREGFAERTVQATGDRRMGEIIKVGMLGVVGVMLAIQFKSCKPEYSTYIGFALGIVIFCYVLQQVEAVVTQIDFLQKYLGETQGYLSILLKVTGITYICEFSAGICRDAGYASVSNQIEILGKLSVMFAGLPILFAVVEQLQGIL